MTTLLFKESLMDSKFIEIQCSRWMSCKQGIYAKTSDGWKLISTSNLFFWGTK